MSESPDGRLILGCMGLGRWDRQPLTAAEHDRAEAVVEAALAIGVTTFDHADIYGHGSAEAVFGELLERSPGLRQRIRIQTKCGIRLDDGVYDLRPAHLRRSVEASLERLRTDHVDTLLLHRPDPLLEHAPVVQLLADLHREGLVRAIGVSNMSGAQIATLQAYSPLPVVSNQLEMSLARRDWLEGAVLVNTTASAGIGFPHGTVEHCRATGVRLQAWAPLAGGRFTGAPREPHDEVVAAAVRDLATEHGTTPETVVLWWLQRHPAGIVPVVGSTDPGRIRACADAASGPSRLTHEQWYGLWITARGEPLP